jgi:hypothetical protein
MQSLSTSELFAMISILSLLSFSMVSLIIGIIYDQQIANRAIKDNNTELFAKLHERGAKHYDRAGIGFILFMAISIITLFVKNVM